MALVPTMLLLLLAPKALAPVNLQLSQYGVARSPFNVNAPEFCPNTPYFTSDTDRALLPNEDSEQTYLKQQQYYWEYSPSSTTCHEPVQSTQSVHSDMVQPQDRPPDALVCPQDRQPDDPVQPQDRPPDRSMDSDRQTGSTGYLFTTRYGRAVISTSS